MLALNSELGDALSGLDSEELVDVVVTTTTGLHAVSARVPAGVLRMSHAFQHISQASREHVHALTLFISFWLWGSLRGLLCVLKYSTVWSAFWSLGLYRFKRDDALVLPRDWSSRFR